MLDELLECGRHLPVLAMVLAWAPPSSWLRLRRARQAFREALSEERLKELAAGLPLPATASLLDAVEKALKERSLSGALAAREGRGGENEDLDSGSESEPHGTGRLSSAAGELHVCELAFLASLHGLDTNEAQQLTGVTPLMRAAEESHLGLCQLLLARRADANSITVGGATALSLSLDPCCMHCMTMSRHPWCTCPRLGVARLLLRHTSRGLPAAFAATVRLALQDTAWLPALVDFTDEKCLPINTELLGPDGRRGTALSVALERRVRPVEAPPLHRSAVVDSLLQLGADPNKQHCYTAWWGGAATNLVDFATLNRCDEDTLRILAAASAPKETAKSLQTDR